jgi:steroid delta-isomerase-like uncharacterized protein
MRKYYFIFAAVILVCASGSLKAQKNKNLEKNKDFIQVYTDDYWNKHNIDAFDKYFTADFIVHFAEGDMNGEQYKGLCQAYFAAFPDLHITTDDLLAEGEKVVKVWTANSTHKGAFMGIPATGNPIVVKGIEMFRIADGKIAELWASMDNLGMLQQLGVIPPMGE